MDNLENQLSELRRKIEIIINRQQALNNEVLQLMNEFDRLNTQAKSSAAPDKTTAKPPADIPKKVVSFSTQPAVKPQVALPPQPKPVYKKQVSQQAWEQFIGGNVLSKVGILVTIIGIFIGVKYSIDHNLISPTVRVINGYVLGSALIGVAAWLRKKYEAYSAALMGGGIAVYYFVTYVAYNFYQLVPAAPAFVIMFACTAGVIWASLKYKNQWVALLGLLGAYAIPVLLSDGSGRYHILFGYIAIINIGIMILAFRQNWKILFHCAFGLTWVIFFGWYIFKYDAAIHFAMALSFLVIYFLTFYVTFLAYKLVKKEQYNAGDVVTLLFNSFLFYGIGYLIMDGRPATSGLLGLFTLINAAIHFAVCMMVKKMELADKALFYLLMGLVFIFITIAVPVQLDGNWVTLLWAGEAALLFRIGRTQQVVWYERISLPLVILSVFSLAQDWDAAYHSLPVSEAAVKIFTPLFNINFLSSLLVMASLAFITYTAYKIPRQEEKNKDSVIHLFFEGVVPMLLIIVTYFTFYLEINEYFNVNPLVRGLETESQHIKYLWLINYSFVYCSLFTLLNQIYFKNKTIAAVNVMTGIAVLLVFLVQGFILLGDLRESYLAGKLTDAFVLYFRYICFAFVAVWLYIMSRYLRWNENAFTVLFGCVLHISILSVICNEFVHQMDLQGYKNQYKLGLSIICGLYAVLLIVLGIWKKKQYLRIGAIVLFGLTLLKLFFYDIAHLPTISKTIVLIILGVLLLVVAFLYNKYKAVISGEEVKKE